MKHAIKFNYFSQEVSVLTRVDVICRRILERELSAAASNDEEKMIAVISIYLSGVTYIEALVNLLLRQAIINLMEVEHPKMGLLIFESWERFSIEQKMALLTEIKEKPVDFNDKASRIKALVDMRNFIIHFKAKPDKFSRESLKMTEEQFLNFSHSDIEALPNQSWVTKLLGSDRNELVNIFLSHGDWLETSFNC